MALTNAQRSPVPKWNVAWSPNRPGPHGPGHEAARAGGPGRQYGSARGAYAAGGGGQPGPGWKNGLRIDWQGLNGAPPKTGSAATIAITM